MGQKGNAPGRAVVGIICDEEGKLSQEEADRIREEAEQRERTAWENAVPLEGNRKNILLFPLALSVGRISEAGIGQEREAALTSLYVAFPGMASEVVAELLGTARRSYAKLMREASRGEPIRVWAGCGADEMCGLCWLMEQLRPVGLEKLEVTLVETPGVWEEIKAGHVIYRNS